MSQLKITDAGIAYKDLVFTGAEVQNITKFIFANVPDLLPTDPISTTAVVPVANVVHSEPVDRVSRLEDNAIVMSAVLGYEVGDFEFNWYGAIAEKADGSEVLIAVVHTALQTKTKTVGANAGNYSVKSIIWRSNAIAATLNVSLTTLPWQVNDADFVSKSDFDLHSHTASDVGAYSKVEVDEHNEIFEISTNETAITNRNKLHVFLDYADLQIPENAGTRFQFMIKKGVVVNADNKCRLIAPEAQKIDIDGLGDLVDVANITEVGVIYTALKIKGVWTIC